MRKILAYSRFKRAIPHHEVGLVSVHYQIPDVENDRQRNLMQLLSLSTLKPIGVAREFASNVMNFSPSPDSNRMALLIKDKGAKESVLRVEVWDSNDGLIVNAKVNKFHGDFVNSPEFGEISWHPSGEFFSYAAEKLRAKEEWEDENICWKDLEDWGEQNEDVISPAAFIFDVEKKEPFQPSLTTLQHLDDFSEGNIVFSNNKDAIEFVLLRYSNKNKLGLIYCTQRINEGYVISFGKRKNHHDDEQLRLRSIEKIQLVSANIRHPRFTKHGWVFLSYSTEMKTHNGLCSLVLWKAGGLRSVCVADKFIETLPPCCFDEASDALYFHCVEKDRKEAYRFDFASKELSKVSAGDGFSTAFVAFTNEGNKLVLFRSNPSTHGEFVMINNDVKSTKRARQEEAKFFLPKGEVRQPQQCVERPVCFETTIHADIHSINSVLLFTKGEETNKKPIVIMPHGGPNSASTIDFSPELNFLVNELNCFVLLINYRGSFGDASLINALTGEIGRRDVSDVMDCLSFYMEKLKQQWNGKVAYCGGSHGGFIGAHISARHSENFACFVLRNPVIDLVSMSATSDIPDWVFHQSGLEYFGTFKIPSEVEVEQLKRMSPISHVASVDKPTQLHVGMKDRRVPPSQGMMWMKALLNQNVPVELIQYKNDSHAIDKPKSNEVMWVTTVNFLKKHAHVL